MQIHIEIVEVAGRGYRANCPSLPGCSVLGRSSAEARKKLGDAILWYLAGLNVAPPENSELDLLETVAELQ